MTPQHLLVVDIETVPDEAHHEGDGFPKPPFHKVVAIGFLHAVIDRTGDGVAYDLQELRCGGDASYSEAKLLQAFFQKSLQHDGETKTTIEAICGDCGGPLRFL